jgi:hypothetical protein
MIDRHPDLNSDRDIYIPQIGDADSAWTPESERAYQILCGLLVLGACAWTGFWTYVGYLLGVAG